MVWQRILNQLGPSKPTGRRRTKRGLRLESMERRELLASDIGAIHGFVFTDNNNNGALDAGEVRQNNVAVSLFRDDGVGSPGQLVTTGAGADTLVGTDDSGVDVAGELPKVTGEYRFENLPAGTYFVQQDAIPGQITPDPVQIVISAAQAMGQTTQSIDEFDTTPVSVLANATNPTNTDSTAATEAIGGSRDIQATRTSGSGNILVEVDTAADGGVGALTISSGGGGVGTALVQYDGPDNSINLDNTGLGGVSLSDSLPFDPTDPGGLQREFPGAGVLIRTRAADSGETLLLRVYSGNGNFSTATVDVPVDASNFLETFVRFDSFVVASGSGANFDNVSAIEAVSNLTGDNDIRVQVVEGQRPTPAFADLANVQPLSLGGQLFIDNSATGQNDGIRQGDEGGITGVSVELYQLNGPDDVVDPINNVAVATATTGANGTYVFNGLIPGNYAVVVPSSQFTSTGSPLFGFANSTGNDPASDPDDNIDDDDEGTVLASGDVISGTITLESNLEPIDDDDTDPNTNTTLDFGFFPQIDLEITKTLNDAGSNEVAGGNALFDVVVRNDGPRDATNVVVTDVFPAGLTFAGLASNPGGFVANINGTTVTIPIGNLAAGTQVTFQMMSNIGANQTSDVTNTATVAGTEVETDTTNNSDDALVDVVATDLRIDKVDLTDPVNAGNQFTYQITVNNDGPDDATGVVVTDPLPAGVTFVSGNVDGAANLVSVDQATGEVTATIGNLANQGQSLITLVVEVAPDAVSPLNNTATVSADPNTDPDLSNNTSDEDTTINRQVDVAVDKSVTGNAIAGGTVTYTVAVSNNGPGTARGVTVVDTLDGDLTFVNGSLNAGASGVTLTQNGQTLTFDVGELDPQESQTFSFDVMLDTDAFGVIPNVATISTTDVDILAANDTDDVDINVGREIDLILTKDVDLATAVPGQDSLVYTFTVSHDTDSLSDGVNVQVSDTLPAGLTGVQIDAPTATTSNFANGVVTVDFASIPVGETRTFTVTVDVQATATGSIVNPATVTADGTELDNTNNSDTATTTLTPDFDIIVDKSVNNATPAIGSTVTYTIDLTNEGPSQASGIVLTDTIPAGLTFNSGTLNGQAGTASGSNVTFPAITLAPGATATATLTFTVTNTANGTITNTASIPDLSAAGENDITNNSDTADIDVTPQADLTIAKTVSAANAAAGTSLTYTINVSNSGPSTATNIVVTDTLPAGVTFDSGTGPGGEALSATGGVVTVNGNDLTTGGNFSFTIIATVNAGVTADLTNTAVVTTDTNETNTANNTATAVTNVDPLTAQIAGRLYIDANENGIFDAGEQGIQGIDISLTGTDVLGNQVDETVQTNAAGDYLFAQLAAGTYRVFQPDQAPGFDDGVEQAGQGVTSSSTGTNEFTNVVLPEGTPGATGFNFSQVIAAQVFSKRLFLASNQ